MKLMIVWLAVLAGCNLDTIDDDDDSEDSGVDFEVAGDPHKINIGFDGAAGQFGVSQFAFFPLFFDADTIQPGPRLCHTYVAWNVAYEPAVMGDATSKAGHRPAFEYWLAHAQTDGRCAEVLVSFQDYAVDGQNQPIAGARCPDGGAPPCDPPTERQVHDAIRKFLAQNWTAQTGYNGGFAFTAWNEPNNPRGGGNGLGKVIPPGLAARYYLTTASACRDSGCKAVAGDFASNQPGDADFEWNCANDNIANLTKPNPSGGKPLCRHPSSKNPNNRPASYLDLYKNTIALRATDYGVADRPAYFAYHGWHDANRFNDQHDACADYDSCVTRRLLKSLSGSWSPVEIWDTEVGSSQGEELSDDAQARGAAFIVRISATSSRIKRIYYTRLHNNGADGGALVRGADPVTAKRRPALCVLGERRTEYDGKPCP